MKKKLYLLCLSVVLLFSACDDWLTIQPETTMAAETLFATDDGITQGLNGAYYTMRGSYSPPSYLGGAGFLECMANTYYWDPLSMSDGYYWAIHMYGQSESQDYVNELCFTNLYNVIANLNSLLNNMVNYRDNLSPDIYKLVRGEAYALRACCHLDVLRIWGPVPSAADAGTRYVPYVRENDVDEYEYHTFDQYMDYLQADLDSAEMFLENADPILTLTFAETESSSNEWAYRYRRSRCNYYAVLALQARAALWRGDNERALTYARLVKDATNSDGSPKVNFTTPDMSVTDYTVTDRTHYTEHIFGIKNEDYTSATQTDSPWAYPYYTYQSRPGFIEELYGENFTSDIRYSHFWKSAGGSWVTDDEGNYVYQYSAFTLARYDDFTTDESAPHNFPIIRLPEMYFIIMECAPLAEANEAYQEYCEARGLEYVPLTESDRQERVMLESLREYAGEGQNYYTYKRNNVSDMIGATTSCSAEQYIVALPDAEYTIYR